MDHTIVITPHHAALPPTATSDRMAHVEQLGDAIAELAARLHAATYELLVLLQQFDAHVGWNNGFLSCAHWLHWRTGSIWAPRAKRSGSPRH